MIPWQNMQAELPGQPRTWLVTGAAGFIGSHLVEALLRLGQRVVALDNLSTGFERNLEQVRAAVGAERARSLRFIPGDIRNLDDCAAACRGVEVVLHQAALGSVPRSIERPMDSHESNLNGFLNLLMATRDAGVGAFVYASSSAVYGDHPALPKQEKAIGRPLSPYALTKLVNEQYAGVFARCYGFNSIGLRYFNVFGPRQDPQGPYAAVIPKWIAALLQGQAVTIYGDGETSRDFCYVANVVQANLLAAAALLKMDAAQAPRAEVYNVAAGGRTTLNDLFAAIRDSLAQVQPRIAESKPIYADFRAGDIRHSQADISAAREKLGYAPTHSLMAGLAEALPWYVANLRPAAG